MRDQRRLTSFSFYAASNTVWSLSIMESGKWIDSLIRAHTPTLPAEDRAPSSVRSFGDRGPYVYTCLLLSGSTTQHIPLPSPPPRLSLSKAPARPQHSLVPNGVGAMFIANQRQSFARDHTDPLTRYFLTPPAGETPEQRALRESHQAAATKRSREIDEWLRAEKTAKEKDKRKRKVQIILVGQPYSPSYSASII